MLSLNQNSNGQVTNGNLNGFKSLKGFKTFHSRSGKKLSQLGCEKKMNKIRQAGYRWSVHPSHGLSFLRKQVREYKSGLGPNASVDGPNIWNFYIFDRPLFDFRTSHCNFKASWPSSLIHDIPLSVAYSR